MKKINYRKLFTLFLWISGAAGLMASLSFVRLRENDVRISDLKVAIRDNGENIFVTENDIRQFAEEKYDGLLNRRSEQVSIPELETLLNAHPAVDAAEVSKSPDGVIRFDVRQRRPVVRVINKDGESYYIDDRSRLMPLSDNYTARVPVVTGEIYEPYARRYQFTVEQIAKNKAFSEVSMLDDILQMASYIDADSILQPLIVQMEVTEGREFSLYPAIGGHRILFGTIEDLELKFEKLKRFYTDGLNKSDSWNKYSTINIKYKNQVVCTKKQ